MEVFNGNRCLLRAEIIKPPTYLSELIVDEDEIVLIYNKTEESPTANGSSPLNNFKNVNDTTTELTGDPLEVDLGGDDSFGSYVKTEKPCHWSIAESYHFPVDHKIAREYLNRRNKIKNLEEQKYSTYVICDGKDSLCTVLLGSKKHKNLIMTCLVNILGCYPKDHELVSLEAMEKDHIKNTRVKNPKIDYLVKFKYYLYGNGLQMFKDVDRSVHYGSVSVEVVCNKCVFSPPQNPSDIKMVFKIIAGHRLSSVHFLWEELSLLQTYIDILSDSEKCNDEFTVISRSHIQESDIYKSINNIITSNLLRREIKINFDLRHIRQELILDKLWNVLKCCENLTVLRDSLHYFFEELVESERNIKIPESDKSNIAAIISGILNGKLAVPTLSFSQALECLFELGAEKLKNDYQAIIKNFYSSSDQLSTNWSNFQNEEVKSQSSSRKTRITVNLKSGVINLNHNRLKLGYLGKLHVATELIFLVKDQISLPEETFDYFCERVYKNYLDKDAAPHDFEDLQNSPLCEFSIVLNAAETNIIQSETPVTWVMQMTSKVQSMEVATTYHLSEYRIFPTVIYDNYDVASIAGENKMVYYVCKLIRHKDFL